MYIYFSMPVYMCVFMDLFELYGVNIVIFIETQYQCGCVPQDCLRRYDNHIWVHSCAKHLEYV